MMHRLYAIFLIFIFMLMSAPAFAEGAMKINSINFDNSDSIIFLGTVPQEDSQEIKITKKTLTEPSRVYFDIENAVITFPNSTFEFKNSRLKQVRAAQNSLEPDIVRIVITSAEDYDTSEINVLNIKNNIIIKLGAEKPLQQYLTQVYKETQESASEYYDKAVISAEGRKTEEADEIFNSVQKAFSIDGQELVRPNIEQKQARLKSRFFLENISAEDGNVMISGIGVINLEKPFTLQEPSRIVFDLPNTIVKQELRDKEFKLSDDETVRIGQFEHTKARIVIKTNKPEKYTPVYGANLQTLMIKQEKTPVRLPQQLEPAEITAFNSRSINSKIDEVNIIFTSPALYSIKRENGRLQAVFYGLKNFNTDKFNAAAQKEKTGFEMTKTGVHSYVLTFPAGEYYADCYETLNASQLRIVLTRISDSKFKNESAEHFVIPLPKIEKPKKDELDIKIRPQSEKKKKKLSKKQKKAEEEFLQKLNSKTVVIDAGHGGHDTGALRGRVQEKDLTLQIAQKIVKYLNEMGIINIIMTRETDKYLTLDERVQISNLHNTAIFVSVHINASKKPEINGIETHYYTENGYRAAKILHKELVSAVNAEDRGLFKSRFYVIKNTEAPAVLLELGFISNSSECSALASEERQNNSAKAIADGIFNFLREQLNGQ